MAFEKLRAQRDMKQRQLDALGASQPSPKVKGAASVKPIKPVKPVTKSPITKLSSSGTGLGLGLGGAYRAIKRKLGY